MSHPDADRPVARLHLDTRAMGPAFCEECEAENEDALLMEDGSVVCPECKSDMPSFEQFSSILTSVEPVRLKRHQKDSVGRTGLYEEEGEV